VQAHHRPHLARGELLQRTLLCRGQLHISHDVPPAGVRARGVLGWSDGRPRHAIAVQAYRYHPRPRLARARSLRPWRRRTRAPGG
ncbi:MAG: hypothetical protein ACK55I_22380, partial [bacterium]